MATEMKSTFEELVELLRCCPAESLPATAESAMADEVPDSSSIENQEPKLETTRLGTPRAKSWDDEWLAAVDAAEERVGRRICGARLLDGTPCELGSDHRSGRCRFHGGFDLTGAPKGNRHAYIHGLYSRRLKTCGDHCPQWSSCPMAQADLANVALSKRPVCPFEQAEYNTALADALDLSCCVNKMNPFAVHIAHNVALLQVMLGRVSSEMRNAAVVKECAGRAVAQERDPTAGLYEHARPHLAAMSRIGSELRKYLALLATPAPNETDWDHYERRLRWVRSCEPGPEPDQFDYVAPDEKQLERDRVRKAHWVARKSLTRAVLLAGKGQGEEALNQWRQASSADAAFTDNWTSRLRKSVRARQRAHLRE